jgi:hypothetical protein
MKIVEDFKNASSLGKLNAISNIASLLGFSALAILQAFLYKSISSVVFKTGYFFIALGYVVFLFFCFFVIIFSFLSIKKYFIKNKYLLTLYYLIMASISLVSLGLIILFGFKTLVDFGFIRIS